MRCICTIDRTKGSELIEILDGNREVQTTIILKVPYIAAIF